MKKTTIACLALLLAAGCSQRTEATVAEDAGTTPTPKSMTPSESLPAMIVHKTASCGCCSAWVEHMRHAGFQVEVRDEDDLNAVKVRLGVPPGKGSCHTAEIGGYVIEGHVPADDIKRLLAERRQARGLLLPGMPMGSPGMEAPDGSAQPYTVEILESDGTTTAYAAH